MHRKIELLLPNIKNPACSRVYIFENWMFGLDYKRESETN